MKVLCVIDSLAGGGAERSMCALANFLATTPETNQVTLTPFRDVPPAIPLDPRIRVEPLVTAPRRPSSLTGKLQRARRLYTTLRRAIREKRPDIVLSFMDHANVIALFAALGSGVPVIVSERVHPESSSLALKFNSAGTRFIYRIGRNALYSRADTIVLQTERSRNSFPARLQPQISVIPNALMHDEKGRPSDISLAKPTILCLGRLSAQKRFDRAIRAFDAVAERFPEWHLAICGSGDQKESLEAMRVGSRAADRIHLTGPTETPLATLRQAAVFILPSDYEGFPSALLEAMSQGCACIATDCPTGPRELLAENSGILVPPGDEGQLAGALAEILDSAQKRSEFGTAARRRASQYLPEQIFPLWLKLLKKRRSATDVSIARPSITS